MSNLAPAPPPETLSEVSRTIRELQYALEQLDVSIEKPSRSARFSLWLRRNRTASSVSAVLILCAIATGSYFAGLRVYRVAGVKLDSHVAAAIDPVSKQI